MNPNLFLILAVLPQIHGFTIRTSPENGWLGWIWGAESTVSVVDRSPIVSFSSRPAAFGEEIDTPILGYVIPVSSFTVPCDSDANKTEIMTLEDPQINDGCPKLCISGPNEPEPSEPWIALVQRGKCEFVAKVREAQRLGARAVVVGGDNPAISGYPDTLVNMFSPQDSSDVKIASTFIRYSDYVELSYLIATSNTSHSGLRTLTLLITAEYSAWEWYSPIITFITILLLPSMLTFLTLLIHRVRASRAAQRERAPEDFVHSLPWQVWTGSGWEKHEGEAVPAAASSDVDLERGAEDTSSIPVEAPSTSGSPEPDQPWFENQMECAICLSEFEKGDKVRVLPCHHIFHMNEVDEWLIQRKKLCPVCKADVTAAHGTVPPAPHGEEESHIPTERTPLLNASAE